jgi:hypothetical protein
VIIHEPTVELICLAPLQTAAQCVMGGDNSNIAEWFIGKSDVKGTKTIFQKLKLCSKKVWHGNER